MTAPTLESLTAKLGAVLARLSPRDQGETLHHVDALLTEAEADPTKLLDFARIALEQVDLLRFQANREELTEVAFHEAGHAVLAFLGHIEMHRLTIATRPADHAAGYLAHRRLAAVLDEEPWGMETILAYVCMELAGPLAAHHAGFPRDEASVTRHRDEAARSANALGPVLGPMETEKFVDYAADRTVGLLLRHWATVETIAHRLLKDGTLEGINIACTIAEAMEQAGTLPQNLAHHLMEAA